MSRGTWKLAILEELISSTDREVRAATVRTVSGKVFNRPLDFLFPLECAEQRETAVQPSRSEGDQRDTSHQRRRDKLANERLIWRAGIKVRESLKKTVQHLITIANYPYFFYFSL